MEGHSHVEFNYDLCGICGGSGALICCDTCPQSFHSKCARQMPKGKGAWSCPSCREGGRNAYKFVNLLGLECPTASYLSSPSASKPSLNLVLKHVEWFLTNDKVVELGQLFQSFPIIFKNKSSAIRDPFTFPAEQSVNFASLVLAVRRIVGETLFDDAYRRIARKELGISLGLCNAVSYGPNTCSRCNSLRYTRRFCCLCGYVFSIKNELQESTLRRAHGALKTSGKRKLRTISAECSIGRSALRHRGDESSERVADAIPSLHTSRDKSLPKSSSKSSGNSSHGAIEDNQGAEAAATIAEVPSVIFPSMTPEERDPAMNKRYAAALAGLDYLYFASLDQATWDVYAGDLLFLIRNIYVCSTGYIHQVAKSYFEEICVHWLQTRKLPPDAEIEDVLDTMEGLHVMSELRRPDSVLATKLRMDKMSSDSRGSDGVDISTLFDQNGQPTMLPEKESSCYGRSRLHNLYIQGAQQRRARKSDGDTSALDDSFTAPAEDGSNPSKRLPRPPYGKRRSIFYDANAPAMGSVTKSGTAVQPSRSSSRRNDVKREIDFAIKESAQEIALQSDLIDGEQPFGNKSGSKANNSRNQADHRTSNEDEDDSTVTHTDGGDENMGSDDDRTINSDDGVSVSASPALYTQNVLMDVSIEEDITAQVPNSAASGGASYQDDSVIVVSTAMRARQAVVNAPNETIPVGRYEVAMNCNRMYSDIVNALRSIDLIDITGFDCTRSTLPMTPRNYCTHCGFDNDPRDLGETCSQCQHVLTVKVDYGSLNDALVWAYVFSDVGVPLNCGQCTATMKDVVKLLPLARSYQRIDELGNDTFLWQCYFITHLIYVFSDWGQHSLPRQLFSEEFEFLIFNMDLVIRLDDPELVGEFLQSLKILQMDEWVDQDLWHVMEAGYNYLIELEEKEGLQGRFMNGRRSAKDRYHSSYCASVGLQDYYYSKSTAAPTPRFLHLLLENH